VCRTFTFPFVDELVNDVAVQANACVGTLVLRIPTLGEK
jgi:hypothetical protein